MHIELTEMLRCPEPHQEDVMVLSTGEMVGRMVRFGLVGCSVCHKAGGFVVLVGDAARHAPGLAALMAGVHFIGINAPPDLEELPALSLLRVGTVIPLRQAIARGVVVGRNLATSPWLVEAHRILLRGRRFVVEHDRPELPIGLEQLAAAKGLWVGEKK